MLTTISIDDVDSPFGGCTTHFAGILLKRISARAALADYPLLIRLNPAIPWKTRGNAAVVIRIVYEGDPRDLLEEVSGLAEEYTSAEAPSPGKYPGVAILVGRPWRPRLRSLYIRALKDVVTRDTALRVAEKEGVLVWGGRGVIGALSSIAALAPWDDYSFELIAYRRPESRGERCVDYSRLVELEASSRPCTYNNFDPIGRRVTATPRGPDPVLAGFRGDCPDDLIRMLNSLCEKPHFWVMYRSNQHTDVHARRLDSLRPYKTGVIEVVVEGKPRVISGGHVIVPVRTPEGSPVDVAFYRETDPLNRVSRELRPGDRLRVLGSIRPYTPGGRPVMAAQKLWVLGVSNSYITAAQLCPRCGRRMKSKGGALDYCPRCGYVARKMRRRIPLARSLLPGEYTPREGNIPHLVKPLTRTRNTRRLAGKKASPHGAQHRVASLPGVRLQAPLKL